MISSKIALRRTAQARFARVLKMTFLLGLLALALHVIPGPIQLQPAHAQGTRKDDIVFNSRGIPLAGATVRVCAMPASGQPCTPLALIYSDPGLTQALANPTTSDGLGNYFFYAAPGKYEIEISGPQITTKQIPNVILPNDPSSPSFNAVSAFSLTLGGNLTVSGNTTVVGNFASGTLNVTNQGTPPGTPASSTVNVYTKTADKRLYYKDDTGTEIGPLGPGNGAQTNVVNTFTAAQNFDADFHSKGPNPYTDATRYGVRAIVASGTPAVSGITATINASSNSATVSTSSCPSQASSVCFVNGDGVAIAGAGATNTMSTPSAPTVTPSLARVLTGTGDVVNSPAGSTTYNYQIIARDIGGGYTAASSVGSTSTGETLGSQSVSLSSCSRANNTVTCTTSSAHTLATGAMVLIEQTIGDGSFNGWYQVNGSADNTHFTFISGQDTRNGASTSTAASGGTVFWWNCNHITWTAVTGAYQYYIYGRSGGSLTLIGVSKPNHLGGGAFTDGTLYWDDFGSPMRDNLTSTPWYIPATPPGSAANDLLVTTISSGAGTTTLTLAANAANSVTNATIRFDNTPNIVSAATAGGTIYFPPSTVSSGSYVTNSILNLSSNAFASITGGGQVFNDTVIMLKAYVKGQMFPFIGSTAQFQFESLPGITCNAIPCFFIQTGQDGHFEGVQLQGLGNNDLLVLQDGGGGSGGPNYTRVNFLMGSNDYMGEGLELRGASDASSSGIVNNLSSCLFSGGPSQVDGASASPLLYMNRGAVQRIDSIFFNRRTMLYRADSPGGGVTLNWGYVQGGIMPFATLTAPMVGGQVGFYADLDNIFLDTTGHPLATYLPSTGGLILGLRSFGGNAPQNGFSFFSGNPFTVSNAPLSGQPGVNLNNAVGTGFYAFGTAVAGVAPTGGTGTGGAGTGYLLAIPVAPSLVASSGGSVPTGNNTYQIAYLDAFGNNSPLGPTASINISSGTQTVTLTPQSLPVGVVGYVVYRNGVFLRNNGGGCSNFASVLGTGNFVDAGGTICGNSPLATGNAMSAGNGPQGTETNALLLTGSGFTNTLNGNFTNNRAQIFPDLSGVVPVSGYQNSAYDNFNRANGAIGANWTVTQNAVNVTSNTIQGTSSNNNNTAFWSSNAFFNSAQFSEAMVTALNGTTDYIGPGILEGGSSGSPNLYDCIEDNATLVIQKVVAGTRSNLATASVTGAVGDVLRLEAVVNLNAFPVATTLTCYQNGVQQLQTTDNSSAFTTGSPGVMLFGNVATLKNWSGGNLHPIAQLDTEQDWTKPQHFTQGVAFGGESFTASPRAEQSVFLPGALTSTWTGSTWTLDKALTVTRVQVQAKTAPAGCTTNAIIRLTDGTSPINVTVSAAANDSGPITQNYAAGASLTVSVQTAAAGCTTSPADANVVVQYRMQ